LSNNYFAFLINVINTEKFKDSIKCFDDSFKVQYSKVVSGIECL